MPDGLYFIVLAGAALGSGLVAGVFFAFSTFVMAALRRLPVEQGIAVMQAINVTVLRSAFLLVFALTAGLSAVLAVLGPVVGDAAGGWWSFAGGVGYLAGSFMLTRAAHIPRNEALARVDPAGVEGASLWRSYLPAWTAWNHVRTLASLAAAGCFIAGLLVR
ncbi:anthrone oxygenase family protein [Saccharomonospora sp. NPDC006951]